MIKLLKWQLLKELNALKWIFIILLAFLLILFISPIKSNLESNSIYSIFLSFSNILTIIIILFFTLMYPSLSLILELRQPYFILEKSIPQPFLKILIIRIIINLFIFSICFLIIKFMNCFSTNNLSYMHLNIASSYLYILLCMVIFYPLVIQFFYLTSSTIPIFKIYPIIGTIIFTALFIKILLIVVDCLPSIVIIIFQIITTIIAFCGSCLLYEKYYTSN